MRNQIIESTHGEIIQKIDLFKDKELEFVQELLPDLKPLKLFKGDLIYQEDDLASEIYLIKDGSVDLLKDCRNFMNLSTRSSSSRIIRTQTIISGKTTDEDLDQMSQDLNFPFIQYLEGSYFGDVEVILN